MPRRATAGRRATPSRRRAASALFWVASFVAPIALMCLLARVRGVYPFGDLSPLSGDLRYQYIDFYTWFRGVLTGENNVLYSFSLGLGSNTWGLYSYYVASPFNLLSLLFDEAHLTDFVFWMTALKVASVQLSMSIFLRRRFGLRRRWTWLLAMSFAWCGWVVTQMRNPMWLDALILLPLGALCCHRLIRRGSFLPLALVVAADVITCWYMAYMTMLFLCLYVLFELAVWVFEGGRPGARAVGGRALRFAAAMLLGLALSAWTFVPTVLAMMGGEGTTPIVPYSCELGALLQGLLPCTWTENLDPQLYTGLAATAAAVLFLANGRVSLRLRALGLAFCVLMVVSSYYSWLEYVWCGMRVPNGYYSRTTFLASFVIVWMAAYGISAGWEAPWASLRAGGARRERREGAHAAEPRRGALPAVLAGALIAASAVELSLNALHAWGQVYAGYEQDSYASYDEESRARLAELRAHDADAFYRVDKTYTRSSIAALDEALALGCSQLSSYTSASDADAIAFLNSVGYSSEGEFSTRYAAANLPMDTLLGLRYASDFARPVGYVDAGLSPVSNGARFYENPYALSLGYLTASAPGASEPAGDNPFERINSIYEQLCGVTIFRPLEAQEVTSDTTRRTWSVEVPAGQVPYVYVTMPPGTDRDVMLSIDGGEGVLEGHRFSHSMRAMADAADETTTHTVDMTPVSPETGATLPGDTGCVFYALDMEAFETAVERLAAGQLDVATFEDGRVTGTVEAASAGSLVLSIPYDRGWEVTVDGEPAQLEPAFGGGMSSVAVTAGTHTVEMTYRSPGLLLGCAVTAVAAAGTVAIAVAGRARRGEGPGRSAS